MRRALLLRFIGKVSYSLFLCHVLVAWYLTPPPWSAFHVPPGPSRFLVLVFSGVPAAIALAHPGDEGIECPLLYKTVFSSVPAGTLHVLAAGGAFAVLCALIAVGEFHRPGCIAEMQRPGSANRAGNGLELSRSSADARGTGLRRTAQAIFRPILDRLRPTRLAVQQELLWSLDREGKTLFEFDLVAAWRSFRYSRRTTGPSASPSPTDTRASGWRSKPWTLRESLPPVITFPHVRPMHHWQRRPECATRCFRRLRFAVRPPVGGGAGHGWESPFQ